MDRRFLNLEAIARWAPLEGETRSTLFASSWKNSFVRLECAVSFVSKGALHKAMVFYVSRRKHQKKNQYNECNQTQDAAVEAVGPITVFLNCAHCKANCTGVHIEVSMRTDPELQSHLAIFP